MVSITEACKARGWRHFCSFNLPVWKHQCSRWASLTGKRRESCWNITWTSGQVHREKLFSLMQNSKQRENIAPGVVLVHKRWGRTYCNTVSLERNNEKLHFTSFLFQIFSFLSTFSCSFVTFWFTPALCFCVVSNPPSIHFPNRTNTNGYHQTCKWKLIIGTALVKSAASLFIFSSWYFWSYFINDKQAGSRPWLYASGVPFNVWFATFHFMEENIFSSNLLLLRWSSLCPSICHSSWWADYLE